MTDPIFTLNTGFYLSERNLAPLAYMAIPAEEDTSLMLEYIYDVQGMMITLRNGIVLFMSPSTEPEAQAHLQARCFNEHGAINIENLEKLLTEETERMRKAWVERMEEINADS